LHEGGYRIAKQDDGTLRFVTADGRTIPRQGYRLEDFVDDDVGGDVQSGPSREGSYLMTVPSTMLGDAHPSAGDCR
jgi:hypothetical protein